MFQVNDVIIYGTQGVCTITGTDVKSVGGVKKTYYILQPVRENGCTVYAPVDNPHVLKKMRRLLTKEEIDVLIDAMPEERALWISDENARKEHYKTILTQGDHMELIKMIKAIYAHKQQREAEGKRLHMADERFFREAEQMLYNEFQYVLKLSGKEDLMTYIFDRIEHNRA